MSGKLSHVHGNLTLSLLTFTNLESVNNAAQHACLWIYQLFGSV